MKKLEEIPKKEVFEVPVGYFDKLPGVIQARVAKPGRTPLFRLAPAMRYALPVLIAACVGLFWYQQNRSPQSIGIQLEAIDEAQLVLFLEDEDLRVEDLVESITWSADEVAELEEQVYSTFETSSEELEMLINEVEFE
jgi:hypothetical protein